MANEVRDGNWREAALSMRVGQLALNELLRIGFFKVPIHLALGHELVALAVQRARFDGDPLILSHRNIHYQLAMGIRLRSLIAAALLHSDDEHAGQTGIMNMMTKSCGNFYTSSILGNNLPVACGSALADKVNGHSNVTWVVTGDGAIEEGAFTESLLLASSLRLPLVFLVEDNGWSLATHVSERRFDIDLELLARAYGCQTRQLDGARWSSLVQGLTDLRDIASSGTPCVVRLKLSTLGGRWVEGQEAGVRRLINYHAGAAPDSALDVRHPILTGVGDPLEHLLGEKWLEDHLTRCLEESRSAVNDQGGQASW